MVVLDLEKFNVARTQTEDGLRDAVEHLNTVLAGACIGDILSSFTTVLTNPATALSEPNLMTSTILAALPGDPRELSSSFIRNLLVELSIFFFSLPADILYANTSRTVGQYRRYVADVWPVLTVVSFICLQSGSTNQTPTKIKSGKRVSLSTSDVARLHNFGIKTPSNSQEATHITNNIVDFLMQILSFYLELLSEPRFRSHCETAYFSGTRLQDGDTEPERKAFMNAKDPSTPLVYLQDRPLQTAFHIQDVDSFGEWEIVISSGATKYLRELRRRDGKKTQCVLRKIRQLSRGEFSGNNYKRLHGLSHGVPIYEADILSDLRLVYQIDCIPDDGGQVERQVVKIYGIFTHKQLDRMWESLSGQLARRGKLYCDRCTFREHARPGTDVYSPASFPPSNEDQITHLSPIAFSDNLEDHGDFVLDKYVKLSKAYLHGLIVDQDIELPFQLTHELEIVQCTTSCFVIGRSGTGKTTSMLFKMLAIQRAWEEAPDAPKPRQLFVTKSPILAAKVEECFTNLVDSLALAGCNEEELRRLRSRNNVKQRRPMIDPLDAVDYRPGTPQKYSELRDHDFPLFITFDQLARMIAADLQNDLSSLDTNNLAAYTLSKVVDGEDSFVTYNIFKNSYWPRLPQRMTKELAPLLVFNEFMGVIKGSELAFRLNGFLDRQTYVNLSSRAYPVFGHERNLLYSLFELYCKLKRECGHYDLADRTYTILKILLSTTSSPRGQRVDYLYVDEAQDNLIVDILLLRILCCKPDGLFWAGDTAQTISPGSSFRFADLKAFIYRIEADTRMAVEKPRSKPTTFQLVVNYRSHNGIINCARAVVELITTFWPYTIDTLQSEHGLINGPKPVFFSGWADQTFPFKHFFSGLQEKPVDLGADQCLLVRDEAARTRFKKDIGIKAVILTLQESKGLEFDDVFLYDFFKDSAADYSQWSLVLGAHEEQMHIVQSFMGCESRYAVLCTELKNLYVGITRAKKNLYLLDNSEKSKPIQEFWTKRSLITDAPQRANIFQYAVESTPEQWAESGHKLFDCGRFEQAIHCFERAHLPRELRIAKAFQLREEARSILQPSEHQNACITAAEAFIQCTQESIGNVEKNNYYRYAAKCYASAGHIHGAADFYIASDDFASAAKEYQKAGYFDDLVSLIKRYPEKITKWYKDQLFELCVRHYYGSKILRSPIPLFTSTEEELDYLEKKRLDDPRILILQSEGRFIEAAEVELDRGKPMQAIQLFLKDFTSEVAIQRAAAIALDNLWQECSFGVPVRKKLRQKGSPAYQILQSVQEIRSEHLSSSVSGQIRLFLGIQQSTSPGELYQIGQEFLGRGDEALALLVFDMRVSKLYDPEASHSTFLEHFENYVRLLASLVPRDLPLDNHLWRRVFAISELPGHRYSVQEGTFLFKKFTSNRFTSAELNHHWKDQMNAKLRQIVLDERNFCYIHFGPSCIFFAVDNRCHDKDCPDDNLSKSSLNAANYNTRINVHFQLIRVLSLMYSALPQKQGWNASIQDSLLHLYRVVHPPIYLQGSIAELDLSSIRDPSGCIEIVQNWIRSTVEWLEPGEEPQDYLVDILCLARLRSAFSDRPLLVDIVSREDHRVSYGEQQFVEGPDDNVARDIVISLDGSERNSISCGVSALRFLLWEDFRRDLSILCDYFEEICSEIVISSHLRRHRGYSALHDLVVPRRWIANLNKLSIVKDLHIYRFLRFARELMGRLRSGRVGGKFVPPRNREPILDISTAKLYRMLCIVGYNICDAEAKAEVSNMIAEILFPRPPNQCIPLILLRPSCLATIQSFDHGATIQDMIHLVHKNSRHTSPVPSSIARLVYENVADIPRLLTRYRDASQLMAGGPGTETKKGE
ncbi:hypothetical protein SCLCIDRAFT_33255 [Scleroderma citrinum Foug A]|uniref:UvrD-like helicase ATP-binding domain-containing protein n=1 Tax=Scleroderma citrinum Foug A TaxID=1036808 RepID=A0A0C2ZFM3_9AGAM|nr:hypothetical protein SCLCIDRAFT_33255 [Scleroderma citrinum Foug A]